MKLSILICSLHSREKQLNKLRECLLKQTTPEVEILIETDNGRMKIGDKRNLLISKAKGDYICFVDDDDRVSDNYIHSILQKTKDKPDVIVFNAVRFDNNIYDREVSYGVEYLKDSNDEKRYFRIPNHLMPVKRELALQVKFKPLNFGEDSDYAKRLLPLLKKQSRIHDILYHYLYNSK